MRKTNMLETEDKIRTILIVDDTPANVALFEAILSHEYLTRAAAGGKEALEIAQKTLPDLILLDIMLPDMDGYEVCRALKSSSVTKNIPVIFVTAMLNESDETRGFEAGGVDYITKPVVNAIVLARVKTHLALKETQDGLEEWNSKLKKRVWQDISTIREKNAALQNVEKLKTEIEDARDILSKQLEEERNR